MNIKVKINGRKRNLKLTPVTIIVLIAVGLFTWIQQASKNDESSPETIPVNASFEAKVIRVSDGDTLTLSHERKKIKIRLYGIDSPEIKQPFGPQAKSGLKKISADKVRVEVIERDQYGRLVGIVYSSNGVNINELQITQGLAWYYPAYCKKPFCDEWRLLEQKARDSKLGLWQTDNPIQPWQWRKNKKS